MKPDKKTKETAPPPMEEEKTLKKKGKIAIIIPPEEIKLTSCWRVKLYIDGKDSGRGVFTGTDKSAKAWASRNADEVRFRRIY